MSKENSKIKKLAKYIQKNPEDSFSKFALALEFMKLEKLDKARILFENIRNTDPGYVGVYYHLGRLYEMLELYEQAIVTYKEGIKIASKTPNKGPGRTVIELEEALEELEQELEFRKNDV